tara:strand:+ start:896 stop:1369 length:474 start_codon:yes stop_codon:yes gene_type:complete
MNKNTLIGIAILLLIFFWWKNSKLTQRVSKKGKKYRCDAGGCLECDKNNTHSSCVSLSRCKEQCQIIEKVENVVNVVNNGTPPTIIGCMNKTQLNYNSLATVSCEGCCVPAIYGCNDPSALNFYAGVTSGYGCVGNNPNNKSCCAYLGENGNIYYGT